MCSTLVRLAVWKFLQSKVLSLSIRLPGKDEKLGRQTRTLVLLPYLKLPFRVLAPGAAAPLHHSCRQSKTVKKCWKSLRSLVLLELLPLRSYVESTEYRRPAGRPYLNELAGALSPEGRFRPQRC